MMSNPFQNLSRVMQDCAALARSDDLSDTEREVLSVAWMAMYHARTLYSGRSKLGS